MTARALVRTLGVVVGAVAVAICVRTYLEYRREIGAARSEALSGSRVIQTARGPVECAEAGEGTLSVLVLHGILGGYDHALLSAGNLVAHGFRIIAPSRFGYLRTPLPLDPSPAAQADAYAALLDELGICRVFVVALSAGSPSALEFALRHADRCAALVFISMADHPRTVPTGQRAVAIDLLSSSDFLFWWQSTHARRTLRRVIGVPRPRSGRQLTNEDRAFLAEMRRLCLPIRPRRLGIRNDLRILSTDGSRPFERVEVPTLIVHAVDDALAPFHQARAAAERIRNASFIALDTGGHFMLGRQEMVRAEVGRFLEANRFETARRAN